MTQRKADAACRMTDRAGFQFGRALGTIMAREARSGVGAEAGQRSLS